MTDYYINNIFKYVYNNNYTELETLLQNVSSRDYINIQNNKGITPLIYACIYGFFQIANILIKYGANVNIQNNNGETALMYCVTDSEHYDILKLLIDNGANVNLVDNTNSNVLYYAVQSNHIASTRYILEKTNININHLNKDGETVLFIATRQIISTANQNINPNFDILRMLILAGVNMNIPNNEQFRVLDYCIYNVVILNTITFNTIFNLLNLARYENNNNVIYLDFNVVDGDGDTYLIVIIKKYGYNDILKLFLDNGALSSINTANNYTGNTPLLIACNNNSLDTVKLLIKYGANINLQNNNGETALMSTSKSNNELMVNYLLYNGADINVTNHDGETALDIAANTNNINIVNLIQYHKIFRLLHDDIKHNITDNISDYKNILNINNIYFVNNLTDTTICSNYNDDGNIVFSSVSDLNFYVFFVLQLDNVDNGFRFCLPTDDYIPFMKENVLANWIKNPNSRMPQIDDMGYGGIPGKERYYSIPYVTGPAGEMKHFINQTTFKSINQPLYPFGITIFTLHDPQTVRLGNIDGRFGVSDTHGQTRQTTWKLKSKDIIIKQTN